MSNQSLCFVSCMIQVSSNRQRHTGLNLNRLSVQKFYIFAYGFRVASAYVTSRKVHVRTQLVLAVQARSIPPRYVSATCTCS